MKINYLLKIIIPINLLLLFSCNSFDIAENVKEVEPISVNINVSSSIPGITSFNGFTLTFKDVKYGIEYQRTLTSNEDTVSGLLPGIYQIDISGKAADLNNDIYLLSDNKVNFPLVSDNTLLDFNVSGLRESNLLFKEIYFAGSKTPLNTNYFRDQFYEIYNNSEDQVIYLDGVYFANLTPVTATNKLPLWPESDGNRYAYADRVWKFPGNGSDYPLAPGESVVISQFAANHQLPQYNPNSPIDGSSSEFEFNMNNPNFPDQPAEDMEHVFYNGLAVMGSIPQYLVSVFGGAYVLFKPLGEEVYDPVNTDSLKTTDLSSSSTKLYAKVPIRYVLDAVEAGHNETMLTAKRVPASLDLGMTYVGETYNSKGVTRKKIGERADGTPILQDSNNSTEDFERGVTPQFRRYGARKPAWSQSYNQ